MLVWVLLMENPRRGLHGTLVAIMQGEGMWPMFAFGFGGIFVITQMHGLNWSRWVRGLVLAAYVAGVVAVYAPLGWERLTEVARIPMIDYAAVFALAGLIGGALGLIRLIRPATASARTPSAPSGVMPEAVVLTEDLHRHFGALDPTDACLPIEDGSPN